MSATQQQNTTFASNAMNNNTKAPLSRAGSTEIIGQGSQQQGNLMRKNSNTKTITTSETTIIETTRSACLVSSTAPSGVSNYAIASYSEESCTTSSRNNANDQQALLLQKQESDRLARLEAERRLAEEAAQRKAKEEADRRAREELARQQRLEAERLARLDAERKAREEAARRAKEEADRKAKEEADRLAKAEADRKAKEAAAASANMTSIHIVQRTAESQVMAEPEQHQRHSPAIYPLLECIDDIKAFKELEDGEIFNNEQAPAEVAPEPKPIEKAAPATTDIHVNTRTTAAPVAAAPIVTEAPKKPIEEPAKPKAVAAPVVVAAPPLTTSKAFSAASATVPISASGHHLATKTFDIHNTFDKKLPVVAKVPLAPGEAVAVPLAEDHHHAAVVQCRDANLVDGVTSNSIKVHPAVPTATPVPAAPVAAKPAKH